MIFEASNGTKIYWNRHTRFLEIGPLNGGVALPDDQVEALREYFLAEQAREMGWFVSKKHPNIVAKRVLNDLDVVDLFTLDSTSFRMDCPVDPEYGPLYEVAQEFLDSEPPHPLESAKVGEVWVIDRKRCFIYENPGDSSLRYMPEDGHSLFISLAIEEGLDAWKVE